MLKRRIAVLVSGGGTNLQALIDAQKQNELGGGEIVLVVSSRPGAYALTRAEKAGIPCLVLQRSDYADHESYTHALTQVLKGSGADLVIMAGFMRIVTRELTDTYKNAVINVHPSLIPSFCGPGAYGLHVHEMALDYGVKVTGATVHFVNEVPDGGPIILQKAVDIQPGDTPETLQRRVMEEAEWKILPRAVALFCQGRIQVVGRQVVIEERESV